MNEAKFCPGHHRPRTREAAGPPSTALLMIALGLVALLAAGCGGEDDGGEEAAADSAATVAEAAGESGEKKEKPEKKEKAIRVNVSAVRSGDLVLPIYADGTIRTPLSVEIRTKIGGELTEVRVRDGDRVRQGQLLARIDPREYRITLQENRYRHLEALSQMAAEADTFDIDHDAVARFVERRKALQDLRDRSNLSRDEYEARLLELEMDALQEGAFRQDVFQQRTGLAEARMAEERARLELEYTEIRAPFAGIVNGMQVVVGEIVAVSAPICQVFNNDELEAVVNVLEADLGNLAPDRPARIAVPATGDTLLTRVDVVSPTLDQASRTCEVIIRFENPQGRFRPGMFVRAEIAGFIHHDRLMVPKAAVLTRDGRPLVFKRQEDDRAQWLYVDTGLQNDHWIEIRKVHSGGSLAPGDEVVVSNHLTLAHEAKIKVGKRIPPLDRWAFAQVATGD